MDKFITRENLTMTFKDLGGAHVLGQGVTFEHVRVHRLMLKLSWKRRD
jgi:hypothetical protein